MEFEWDDAKAVSNQVKHGIDFDDAVRIFAGPTLEWRDNRRDYGEARVIAVGIANEPITVVYTLRGGAMRIISARKSHKHEREAYFRKYPIARAPSRQN
jgi:uncharacterized DUF497 family protein